MPQDVDFGLPWPLRVNQHLDAARERNLAWMLEHRLLEQTEDAITAYQGWRLAEVAAYFYPEAPAEGLDLATDLMGWYFGPFDDQFDSPLGKDPIRVARLCGALVSALHENPPSTAGPSVLAFAEIWRRCLVGMPAAWRARAATHWAEYFAVHVTEAQLRRGDLPPGGIDAHLRRRRRSTSAYVVNDLAERVSGFLLPEVLWQHEILGEMRDVAADVVTLCQDTVSVEKEEYAEDRHNNLLLILEAERGLSRRQSIAEVRRMTAGLIRRFRTLEGEAEILGRFVSGGEHDAVSRFVRHLCDYMRGHGVWAAKSSRYCAPHDDACAVSIAGKDLPSAAARP